jgi:hypothetical protein
MDTLSDNARTFVHMSRPGDNVIMEWAQPLANQMPSIGMYANEPGSAYLARLVNPSLDCDLAELQPDIANSAGVNVLLARRDIRLGYATRRVIRAPCAANQSKLRK